MPNSRSSRSEHAARGLVGTALFAFAVACGGSRSHTATREPAPHASATERVAPTSPSDAGTPRSVVTQGDVQDILAARIVESPTFHVFTGEACEPLELRSELEDGSAGLAAFRGSSIEYWIECGYLGNGHLSGELRAIEFIGKSRKDVRVGSEVWYAKRNACEVARRP